MHNWKFSLSARVIAERILLNDINYDIVTYIETQEEKIRPEHSFVSHRTDLDQQHYTKRISIWKLFNEIQVVDALNRAMRSVLSAD